MDIYFPNARLSLQIRSGPVLLTKSIIFSGNSIQFLDFSYLLSGGGGGGVAILDIYFPNARLSLQIRCGPVLLTKSIIFSGNSIQFLDFSYLLSIFFLLDDAFASPGPCFFRQPY